MSLELKSFCSAQEVPFHNSVLVTFPGLPAKTKASVLEPPGPEGPQKI